MSGYKKPRVVCPFCERDGKTLANGQPCHYTVNGMTAHVRANHPGDYEDWHSNKEKYVASHACDDNGTLMKGGSPPEGSFPESNSDDTDDEEEYYIEELPDNDDDDEPEPDEPPRKPKPDPKPGPEPNPKSEPEHDPFWDCALS